MGDYDKRYRYGPNAVECRIITHWSLPNLARGAQPSGHSIAPWLTKAATVTNRREESAIAAVTKYLRRFILGPDLENDNESTTFTCLSRWEKVILSSTIS
jgi:hypothetical protein